MPDRQVERIAEGDEDLARLLTAALELNRRIATAHERVACPVCFSPAGIRCRHLRRIGVYLKHSHGERLRADGISLR